MKRELTIQVGHDGVLMLGREWANKTVRVVVEVVKPFVNREEWLHFVNATSGKWQGEFQRPPQGEYEERDSL